MRFGLDTGLDGLEAPPPPSPTPSNFIAGRPKAAPPFCLLLVVLFFFSLSFQARFIVVVSIVFICLVCDSSIVATCPSMPSARFVFFFVFFVWAQFVLFLLFFFFVNQSRTKGEVGRQKTSSSTPVILSLADPRRLFCVGSYVILDVTVVCCYFLLFLLYISIEIGKNRC